MLEDPLQWILIIIAALFGAFFSLAETSFAAVNIIRLRVDAERSTLAKRALTYIERFDASVILTVIGSNIASILISTLVAILFISTFENPSLATLLATLLSTLIFYLFCDTIPKMIARAIPNKVTLMVTVMLPFFSFMFKPIHFILSMISTLFSQLIPSEKEPLLTEDDFVQIVEEQVEAGVLEEDESELIQSAVDFADTTVKEVYTPIKQVYSMSKQSIDQMNFLDLLIQSPYSRIPIYDKHPTDIIGVISVRNFINQYLHNPHFHPHHAIKPIYHVQTSILLDELFEGFKKHRTHIALVKDQHNTIGMITMEDVIEAVLGD